MRLKLLRPISALVLLASMTSVAVQGGISLSMLLLGILFALIGGIYWIIRQAAAWGEGIGYDDGYFDADDLLSDGW